MASLASKRLKTLGIAGGLAGWALLAPASALAHGGEHVPVGKIASAWSPEPAVLGAAALALALFVQAWVRLRRRGRPDHASVGRLLTFLAGLALGVLPLVSPLDAIGEEYLLSAHMLEHVLIGDAAVALIVLSVRGPLLFFLLPSAALGPLARSDGVRAVLRFLGRPTLVLAAWCTVIAAWHVPTFYDATLTNQAVHDLEHVMFVIVGLLAWNLLIDPARRGELTRSGRLGLMVALFTAGQVLSALLLFTGRPLYPAYAFQNALLPSVSPLVDQRLAGAVMMAEQAITLGALGAFLLLAAEQEERRMTEVQT
jgi:putative membrane protein